MVMHAMDFGAAPAPPVVLFIVGAVSAIVALAIRHR